MMSTHGPLRLDDMWWLAELGLDAQGLGTRFAQARFAEGLPRTFNKLLHVLALVRHLDVHFAHIIELVLQIPVVGFQRGEVHGRFAEIAQFTCVRNMLSVFVRLFLLFDVEFLRHLEGRGEGEGEEC